MSDITKLIKDERKRRGYSLETLAGLVHISQTQMRDIEAGNRSLKKVNMINLAHVLYPSKPEVLYDAYANEDGETPYDITQYILDNDLIKAIRMIKEKDSSGSSLIELAMSLNSEKTRK